MDTYVDGFLIPLATDRIDEYKAIASLAGQVWKDHGALAYYEPIFLRYPVSPRRPSWGWAPVHGVGGGLASKRRARM